MNLVSERFEDIKISSNETEASVKEIHQLEFTTLDIIETFDRMLSEKELMTMDCILALFDHLRWEQRGVRMIRKEKVGRFEQYLEDS